MKRILSFIILICIILSVFTSCGENESFVAYFELDNKIQTLDPQLANSTEDKILIKNLYEGLMRENAKGEIVCGAAKDFTVSNDGLTYTFFLRDGILWSNDQELTAKDFEFAFQRALDPITKAPYAHLLSDVSSFKALDDNKFTITLKRKNNQFLEVLCKPICMPCNKAFFVAAKGKYGLDNKHILTNGSFTLKKWIKDGEYSLRISANPSYNGEFVSTASSINMSLGDITDRATRLEKEYLEFGFVEYTNANRKAEKVNYYSSYDTIYVLLINPKGLLQSKEMRLGIEKSIDRNKISNTLNNCFKNASSILPPSIKLNNSPLSDVVKLYYSNFDAKAASEHYRKAIKEYKYYDLSGLDIAYIKDDNIKLLATTLAETWQQTIDGYINIKEYESKKELNTDIANRKYDFAIVPYTVKDGDIYNYLSNFGSTDIRYTPSLNAIKTANTDAEIISSSKTASSALLLDKLCIPLVYSATVFAASSNYNIPIINPDNGYIDFSLVTKK